MGVLNTGGRRPHRYSVGRRIYAAAKSIRANIRGEGIELSEALDALRSQFRVTPAVAANPPSGTTWGDTTDTQIIILATAMTNANMQNIERIRELSGVGDEVDKIALYIRDHYPVDQARNANAGRTFSEIVIGYMSGRRDGDR